ncbi:hypothetical protein PAHAL_9G594700 [Panicum hallii]|uniref:X8 domain-containing protein n=1 Tax=Panicum hallii TaxID=206008 RepID=A0A2S3IUR4_9POAL|nr:hypothetical protein PAHAL_9G594700 [Panicum hallii]
MVARAVVVAVLLMQCCNVILAARPLLHAAAGDYDGRRGWRLGQGGEALIMQALDGPGQGNCRFKDPNHPHCVPAAAIAAMP